MISIYLVFIEEKMQLDTVVKGNNKIINPTLIIITVTIQNALKTSDNLNNLIFHNHKSRQHNN